MTHTLRAPRLLPIVLAVVAVVGALLAAASPPVEAAEACAGDGCDTIVLHDGNGHFVVQANVVSGGTSQSFTFGEMGDTPLMGDWNCDGVDTPGTFRNGYIQIRNSNTSGAPDAAYHFGDVSDIPLAGDFDGDGCDTVSLYRRSEGRVYLNNTLGSAPPDRVFYFGNPGDRPFVGDFDGDGVDTVGLHRVSTGLVYFRDSNTQGPADYEFIFGDPNDVMLAGDWNDDGRDTVAVYRPSNQTLYLKFNNTQGVADAAVTVGAGTFAMTAGGIATDTPTAGGVATDTPTVSLPVTLPTFDIDVEVNPGMSLEAAARNNPAGTVFRISGTHTGQSVSPKDGQVFIAAAGARLDGNGEEDAFHGSADGVWIVGLEITDYSGGTQHGAVHGSGEQWVVWGNDIHHNEYVGVRVTGNGSVLRQNHIHHNNQLGVSVAFADDALVEDNEISYNNWQNDYNWGWEAGSTKFWETDDLVVRGNFSHHNQGPGLWSDGGNIRITYEENRVEDNLAAGIFHEIGYDAVIRNNVIKRNGFGHQAWLWGAGVVVAASQNVEIYGNHIEDNYNGIGVVQQDRGSGRFGPYVVKNVNAHHNTIIDSGRTGAARDTSSEAIFSSNNRFDYNTYQGDVDWEWDNRQIGWGSWRGFGHDGSGSYTP